MRTFSKLSVRPSPLVPRLISSEVVALACHKLVDGRLSAILFQDAELQVMERGGNVVRPQALPFHNRKGFGCEVHGTTFTVKIFQAQTQKYLRSDIN